MFMNVAYLNNSMSAVVDDSRPLIVTCCGNYRIKKRSEVVTSEGQKRLSAFIYCIRKRTFFHQWRRKNGFRRKYHYIFTGSATGICLLPRRSN